jgi:hypothetical protein
MGDTDEGLMSERSTSLLLEQLRSPAEIARILPPGRVGRPVHPQTVVGWIRRGVPLPDGSHLFLEAVRCASKWYTSVEAVARFCESQTPRLRLGPEQQAAGSGGHGVTSSTTGQETANGS